MIGRDLNISASEVLLTRVDASTRRRVVASTRRRVDASNFAQIAAKLRENAFRTICNFPFFDAEKFSSENFPQFLFGFS